MKVRLALLAFFAAVTLACPRREAQAPAQGGAAAPSVDAGHHPSAQDTEEACVDRWLAERTLDAYGSPQGTVYAGGTPLFDEATGQTRARLPFVYARHPDARAACER